MQVAALAAAALGHTVKMSSSPSWPCTLNGRTVDEPFWKRIESLPLPRKNVNELTRLQTQVAEGLKRFEFGLRRRVDADGNTVALSGSEEMPEEFRKLVEQYFKSLARSGR